MKSEQKKQVQENYICRFSCQKRTLQTNQIRIQNLEHKKSQQSENLYQQINSAQTQRNLIKFNSKEQKQNLKCQNKINFSTNNFHFEINKKNSIFYHQNVNQYFWYYQQPYCVQTCSCQQSQALDCICQTAGCPIFILGQFCFSDTKLIMPPCLIGLKQCIYCNCAVFTKKLKNSRQNCDKEPVCCCNIHHLFSKLITCCLINQ